MMRGGRGEESGKGDLIVKCVLCMYYTLCAGACVRANALRIVYCKVCIVYVLYSVCGCLCARKCA